MKFFIQVFCIQLKRLLKNKGLMAVFILLPFLSWGIVHTVSGQEEAGAAAGICLESPSPLGEQLVDRLTQTQGELVQFLIFDTPQQMKQQILQGKLECGFSLKVPLEQAVQKENYRKIFTCFQTGSTGMVTLMQEIVASQVMQVCGGEQAVTYMGKSSLFEATNAEAVSKRYREYLTSEEMMGLETEILGQEKEAEGFRETAVKQLVQGVVSVFLLIASLLASFSAFPSQTVSRLAPMRSEAVMMIAGAAALGVLSLLFAIVTLVLCPLSGVSLWQAGLSLLAYQFALCGLAGLLNRLKIREETVLSLLPFVIAGCLLLCPIITDVTAYLPALRPLNGLLLPTLYLKGSQGSVLSIFTMVFYGFLMFLLSLTKWRKEIKRV